MADAKTILDAERKRTQNNINQDKYIKNNRIYANSFIDRSMKEFMANVASYKAAIHEQAHEEKLNKWIKAKEIKSVDDIQPYSDYERDYLERWD